MASPVPATLPSTVFVYMFVCLLFEVVVDKHPMETHGFSKNSVCFGTCCLSCSMFCLVFLPVLRVLPGFVACLAWFCLSWLVGLVACLACVAWSCCMSCLVLLPVLLVLLHVLLGLVACLACLAWSCCLSVWERQREEEKESSIQNYQGLLEMTAV